MKDKTEDSGDQSAKDKQKKLGKKNRSNNKISLPKRETIDSVTARYLEFMRTMRY